MGVVRSQRRSSLVSEGSIEVVIFGATGMMGKGALLECLDDRRVESVLIVVRHRSGASHPKLHEIIHKDFSTSPASSRSSLTVTPAFSA